MSYDMQLQVLDDYIRIDISGERKPDQVQDDAREAMAKIAELCRQSGRTRVLAVSTIAGRISPLDTYQLASDPKKFNWSMEFDFALVDLNAESREDNAVTELVATNRNWSMKVFDNEGDAIAWLMQR